MKKKKRRCEWTKTDNLVNAETIQNKNRKG